MTVILVALWIALAVYVAGFLIVFVVHLKFLQMVTPGLAFVRALVWPIYWLTGWPHGSPQPMD